MHQMPTTAMATKNMPGILIPTRLPTCGTSATASSSQKRGICGRRQNASAPLNNAPKMDSVSIVRALPVDTGDDDARSGRAKAGGSGEEQRTGDKSGD